jgi:hypothetical protein
MMSTHDEEYIMHGIAINPSHSWSANVVIKTMMLKHEAGLLTFHRRWFTVAPQYPILTGFPILLSKEAPHDVKCKSINRILCLL